MIDTMPRKKRPQSNGDRHKARTLVGIPNVLMDLIDVLVERHLTDRTAEVVRLVREGLEREGLWQPRPVPDTEE